MASEPASPTSPTKPRRDTGFPEPFCGHRNTTLPHPEADLSPNASITADDIDSARIHARTRRSFLIKHKRTISHGVITPEMEAMYRNSVFTDGEAGGPAMHGPDASNPTVSIPSIRVSRDGTDSFGSGGETQSPFTEEHERLRVEEDPQPRRRSMLHKFRTPK